MRKKIKNFDFLKHGYNDFDKILWVYGTLEDQQYDTICFPRKNPWNYKYSFQFSVRPNVTPKPTDKSRSNSISRAPLQIGLSLALFFSFRSILKIKGS